MKKQIRNQFSPIEKNQADTLTSLVKETLAIEISQVKTFSTADLWNIQRKCRTIMSRRHFI